MDPLNKIPVLDNGFIALLSKSLSREQLLDIKLNVFKNRYDARILELPQIHLIVKCPLFVQLSFMDTSLKALNIASHNLECFIPAISDIKSGSLETDEAIQRDLQQTSEALLLNVKSYQQDGCDLFIAQNNIPVSVYNTIMVTGTFSQWLNFINKTGLPLTIEAYRLAIASLLKTEFDLLWIDINGQKK